MVSHESSDVRGEPSLRSKVSAAARAEGGSSGSCPWHWQWACVCSCEFVCLREEKEVMLHLPAGTGIVKACASSNDLIIIIKIIIGNGGG